MPSTNATNNSGSVHRVVKAGSEKDFSKSFSMGRQGNLDIDVDCGEVQVRGADQDTVTVQVHRMVRHADDAAAENILAEEDLTLEQAGSDLMIRAHPPASLRSGWNWPGSKASLDARFTLVVPRNFNVKLKTSGGSISVAATHGTVRVHTEGGGLDFDNLEGSVDGETQGGGIRATDCKGELVIKTEGGGITVKAFAGPFVRGSTQGGSVDVDFAEAPKSDCVLETEGGSINARIHASAAINLDAHTEGGGVSSDLPVAKEGRDARARGLLRGTVNGGGPTVKLSTEGGSIRISKR